MRIPEGSYQARVIDYGVGSTKAGLPQVEIKFGFMVDGQPTTMYYFGGFGEKSLKHTVKALAVCGFTGDEVGLSDSTSGALDMSKDVLLVVSDNEYNGTVNSRIQWINEIDGGGSARAKLTKEEVRSKLATVNIKGQLAAIRAEMGLNLAKPKAAVKADDSDLPF